MKYIKTFEKLSEFEIDDLVKFLPSKDTTMISNDIFKIIDITYADRKKYNTLLSIGPKLIDRKISWMLDRSIRHLTEDEKIEIESNKYNL